MRDPLAERLQGARQALRRGRPSDCRRLALEALELAPDNGEAVFLSGIGLAESGRIRDAVAPLQRAVELSPLNAEYAAQLARILLMLRREEEARQFAESALDNVVEDDALTLDTIGCVYARLGDHEIALNVFEKAVALAPDMIDFRFNLVATYGFFGRKGDAERQYEEILKRRPTHGKSHLGLAALRRQTDASNHISDIENALGAARDPIDRLRIHYAAAKEYEDVGRYDRAFQHLETANRDHTARLGYDIRADEANVAAIIKAFSDPSYIKGVAAHDDAPIFVMGLPRTGTTLVEQILAAHPDVSAAGELQSMPLAIKRVSGTPSRLVLDTDTIERAGAATPEQIGGLYLSHARQHKGAKERAVFIDKLPLNFLYVGYIRKALPNARIVCLRRHPMDSIWSNYKNLFATTSSYYAYSYDLMNTARFYCLFDKVMAFWKSRFPGGVLEFGYEALTEDQEAQTASLLDYCGLEWNDACLDFHHGAQAVATPSAVQVREPLYRRSVDKWRRYEDRLQDVMAFLKSEGVDI